MTTHTTLANTMARHVPGSVRHLAHLTADHGGTAYLVGGAVRDSILGHTSTDIDIELHGVTLEQAHSIASNIGVVKDVGAAFGVLKVHSTLDKLDFDVSLPRRDSKQADANKRGITAETDPHMGIVEAARRRDFTMNAIAYNPATNTIHDPFNGVDDLVNGRLRIVDPVTFAEDALRVLRAGQLAGRFNLTTDEPTRAVLAATTAGLATVSAERVLAELEKLLMKADRSSIGLQLLHDVGALSTVLPTLEPAEDTHGQLSMGDRFALVDAIAATTGKNDRFVLTLSALLLEPTANQSVRGVLARLRADNDVQQRVGALTTGWKTAATNGLPLGNSGIRQLADALHPATGHQLLQLLTATADCGLATNVLTGEHLQQFQENSEALGAFTSRAPDVITGRMLIAAGLTPGPTFKELIRRGNQLSDEFGHSPEMALALTIGHVAVTQ